MYLRRYSNQTIIQSPICGLLKNVLRTKDYNFVLSENIRPTEKHYHKLSTEHYYVINGWLKLEVTPKNKNMKRIVKIGKGDMLIIEPGDVHQVTSSSKNNKLLVFSIPAWKENDEIVED